MSTTIIPPPLNEKEVLLRMATRLSRLGAWRVDLPTLRITWSDEVRQIHEVEGEFRPTIEQAVAFYAPEYRKQIQEAFLKCVSDGTPYDLELEILTAKGRRLWVRAIAEAVRNAQGNTVCVQGAFQDISERVEAERRMQESARMLASTLENMTDGFFILDREWKFTYLNAEAERLMQKPREDLIGRCCWEIYPEAAQFRFRREYERAFAENVAVFFEEYYAPYQIWIGVRAYPSAESLAVYIRDVTEEHLAMDALRLSEERFQLIAKATNDVIWDWEIEGGAHWVGEGFLSKFGYTREELGTNISGWKDKLHPEDRERTLNDLEKAIERGDEAWQGEYRFLRKDGTYAYVLDRGYVMRNENGKAVRMVGSMTDLSQRREADERIAEQAALLDHAQDAIFVKDLGGKILYWNRGAERVFGYTQEEALGMQSCELMKNDFLKHQEALSQVLRTGEWHGEVSKRGKHGRDVVVYSRWTLMRDGAGNPKSILTLNCDMTEKKKLEAQFLRAQRMESIGTLAGGIAHDLNNVLAPITMCMEMLEAKLEDPEDQELLRTLNKSAQRGAELVRQVLSFARGIEGKRVTLNANHILREIQKIARDTFPKNIEFISSAQKDLWTVSADPTQLHQVMMNLCVNARDAMPAGGRLKISAENEVLDNVYSILNPEAKEGSYVVLTVADTGSGIPPEIREKIFDPFFTTKEVGKGTGLGLSTTLGIVKSHGGFINVYSEVGKGTKFKVYLPAGPVPVETADDSSRDPLPQGNGATVLLVDDEETVRVVAKRTLEKYGYNVCLAKNGAEAVSIYATERERISLVLTDMAMPIMDGAATAVALKNINPQLRIVGSSGLSSNVDAARSAGADIAAFIPKPYSAEDLLTILHQVNTGNYARSTAGVD